MRRRGRPEDGRMFQLLISLIGTIVPICVEDRPISATHGAGKEETRCAPACRRKGWSNVRCGAIPSQSSRIQGVSHQHTAFAERNEGIPRSRADLTTLAENEEWMAVHLDRTIQRRKNSDNRT